MGNIRHMMACPAIFVFICAVAPMTVLVDLVNSMSYVAWEFLLMSFHVVSLMQVRAHPVSTMACVAISSGSCSLTGTNQSPLLLETSIVGSVFKWGKSLIFISVEGHASSVSKWQI